MGQHFRKQDSRASLAGRFLSHRIKWQRGDLGRFQAESPKRPRFEVIGRTKDHKYVEVWYGGANKATGIPKDTFLRDCSNLWELQEVVPPHPAWLREGAAFEFPHNKPAVVRQNEIVEPKFGRITHATTADLRGQGLTIRRIRRDYASCFIANKGLLFLVPLATVVKLGIQRKSRWDYIASDEEPYEEDTSDDDLFKDL